MNRTGQAVDIRPLGSVAGAETRSNNPRRGRGQSGQTERYIDDPCGAPVEQRECSVYWQAGSAEPPLGRIDGQARADDVGNENPATVLRRISAGRSDNHSPIH